MRVKYKLAKKVYQLVADERLFFLAIFHVFQPYLRTLQLD